ncbi:MAG: diaminopimelate epimerase [Proteobacteria bacterium]|nr:diaminopimelate epimerase [Pseudomonadota bacterium]
MEFPFIKMHGLGNDFVIVDYHASDVKLALPTTDDIILLADRHLGVGCDQLIILKKPISEREDCVMEIYNSDGSRAGACGNATRCVALLLGQPTCNVSVGDRVLKATKLAGGKFAVNMGMPLYDWEDIPLEREVDNPLNVNFGLRLPQGACVNMGNPHVVFFVPNMEGIDLASIGRTIEHHSIFPQQANVSFAVITNKGHIHLHTWERGVGKTSACGSAACAAVAAGNKLGLLDANVTVHLQYGQLEIELLASGEVMMTGPASLVARGIAYI